MGGETSQHLLQMTPRTDLVAKKMFGHAHHTLAEQLIARVRPRPPRYKIMEPLHKWQRSTVSIARGVIEKRRRSGPGSGRRLENF